ncbi:MAG: 2-phospho-L-lactate transferase [Pseudomonadota bacterium]
MTPDSHYLAFSGGVGGAKLALGLARLLDPGQLNIVANTGDDFQHLGFHISPDIDTVIYTLAGLANPELGWGQAGETWQCLEALERLGGETWFQLGDRDLATHIRRTSLLAGGATLSEATAALCQALGVVHRVIPMSDDPVPTQVLTRTGEALSFQHYFVRDRCMPAVTGFEFAGIAAARPAPAFLESLRSTALRGVVICPSNPFVSVDPVLALPGVMELMKAASAPVVAVSPIVGGQAIKGPAAKMMQELGMPQTALAVAQHYQGRIDGFVLDQQDEHYAPAVERLGMSVQVTNTMMLSLEDRINLATAVLGFIEQVSTATRTGG